MLQYILSVRVYHLLHHFWFQRLLRLRQVLADQYHQHAPHFSLTSSLCGVIMLHATSLLPDCWTGFMSIPASFRAIACDTFASLKEPDAAVHLICGSLPSPDTPPDAAEEQSIISSSRCFSSFSSFSNSFNSSTG